MINKKYDLKTNPCKTYYSIMTRDGKYHHGHNTRTRNIWNETYTGKFVSYDHLVADVQTVGWCDKCNRSEFVWLSEFSNGKNPGCRHCGSPLVIDEIA